jgi:hypothetical protein
MPDSPTDAIAPATRTAVTVLFLGLALGVLGDALFHGARPGLNAPLWIAALLLAGFLLHRRAGGSRALSWLVGLPLFFAACLAWRASPFLRFWNAAAVLAAAVTLAVHLRGGMLRAWPRDYVRGAADATGDVGFGAVVAAGRVPWSALGTTASRRRMLAGLVGVVLAVPVVAVFGALLMSADPVMDAFARRIIHWDLTWLVRHCWLVGLTAWVAAGWLYGVTLSREGGAPPPPVSRPRGAIELGIPLGALTLLLASFIGLQARYLFGGEAVIRLTGMTYAELARRGFFELVTLCGLVLPVLLGAQRLLDRGTRAAVESFRALVPVLVTLVGLVMVSALVRMRLYVMAYGLSEDRLYATAFMLWLGGVFVWLAATELRQRLERFATGAVLAGFLVLAGLNALNPDAVVARVNIARAAAGAELDVAYLGRLSSDAIPAVAARWATLDPDARCALQTTLLRGTVHGDWREWTWSAWRADRAVRRAPARTAVEDCRPTPGTPPDH